MSFVFFCLRVREQIKVGNRYSKHNRCKSYAMTHVTLEVFWCLWCANLPLHFWMIDFVRYYFVLIKIKSTKLPKGLNVKRISLAYPDRPFRIVRSVLIISFHFHWDELRKNIFYLYYKMFPSFYKDQSSNYYPNTRNYLLKLKIWVLV